MISAAAAHTFRFSNRFRLSLSLSLCLSIYLSIAIYRSTYLYLPPSVKLSSKPPSYSSFLLVFVLALHRKHSNPLTDPFRPCTGRECRTTSFRTEQSEFYHQSVLHFNSSFILFTRIPWCEHFPNCYYFAPAVHYSFFSLSLVEKTNNMLNKAKGYKFELAYAFPVCYIYAKGKVQFSYLFS